MEPAHRPAAVAPYGVVVAVSRDGVIGRDGDLPWHHPEDLRHFKRATLGHALVMGRKTWVSFGAKPLPRRRHLIVSRAEGRDPDGLERDGARWFASPSAAVAWWQAERAAGRVDGDEQLFVIGGGQLFAETFGAEGPWPDPLILTWVPAVGPREGDVCFPVDRSWIEARYATESRREDAATRLEFVVYRLRATAP